MAAFDYRCRRCGVYEAHFPIGTAPGSRPCPRCGDAATRVFSPPALLPGTTAVTRAIETDHRSAYEPAVVGAPPPGSRTRISANPLHAKLPRP